MCIGFWAFSVAINNLDACMLQNEWVWLGIRHERGFTVVTGYLARTEIEK